MNDKLNETQEPRSDAGRVDEGRRRLTKAGVGASALVVTLASRSALGGVCRSPSGFTSGNLSQHGTPPPCNGRTPGYWKEKNSYGFDCTKPAGDWSVAGKKPGYCSEPNKTNDWSKWRDKSPSYVAHKFKDVFSCNGYLAHLKGPSSGRYSLMQVMHFSGNMDPSQLGAHLAAALLNATSGKNTVPNEMQVIQIAYEYDTKGYYEPMAGKQWGPSEIVDYLKSTMD